MTSYLRKSHLEKRKQKYKRSNWDNWGRFHLDILFKWGKVFENIYEFFKRKV